MDIEHLVRMANEISLFFESEAGPDAPKEVASHLRKFWEPRMRTQIIAHYHKGAGGLDDIARDAVAILAQHNTPLPEPPGGDAG
jgi:formate dehydrogenase subunit delta